MEIRGVTKHDAKLLRQIIAAERRAVMLARALRQCYCARNVRRLKHHERELAKACQRQYAYLGR